MTSEHPTMAAEHFQLNPGQVELTQLRRIYLGPVTIELNQQSYESIRAAEQVITNCLQEDKYVYGINTGFGLLAQTRISNEHLDELQSNLILSHCAGVGDELEPDVVRLIVFLKINSLAQGYSGISVSTLDALITFLNHDILPCIPAKGSVGASGDLAPLAHMTSALMGIGDVFYQGERVSAKAVLDELDIQPVKLGPKEGLAFINGTQVSTALALAALFKTEHLFAAAVITGSLSVDAIKGTDTAFDQRIHAIRGQPGQILLAEKYWSLLKGSKIRLSHMECEHVQDPYSIRCQPQVMGACLDQINHVSQSLLIEANAVTDNPLVFAGSDEVLSGGNFHAEPVALAADILALAIAEIGGLSERRIALLIDPNMSGLPAFLVEDSGINSGFMVAQVTAAALASENKSLAHPASVDSIPTSANQEDHVSMATYAARRLSDMVGNSASIVAIELLAAAQGIEFHLPLTTSKPLQQVLARLRKDVTNYNRDRYFLPDIQASKRMIDSDYFLQFIADILPSTRDV